MHMLPMVRRVDCTNHMTGYYDETAMRTCRLLLAMHTRPSVTWRNATHLKNVGIDETGVGKDLQACERLVAYIAI